jgi:uncharacterized DUF497 family protein
VAAFIWTTWNIDHVAKHGITRAEAQYVIERARPPYPQHQGDEKFLVRGRTSAGRYVQVIFVLQSAARGIDWTDVDLVNCEPDDDAIYVIHARPLTPAEVRGLRRRRK